MPGFLVFLRVYHHFFFFYFRAQHTMCTALYLESVLQAEMFSNEDVPCMPLLFIAALSAFVFLCFYSHIPEAVLK